jgi:hypothetical protein
VTEIDVEKGTARREFDRALKRPESFLIVTFLKLSNPLVV